MAAATNFYTAAKNNPEVLERRRARVAALDAEVKAMAAGNPGREPAWEAARVMAMDRAALELGKRCVMWDDAGAGFYLMLNWDWVANRPAAPPSPQAARQPGWWANARRLLTPPLLDPGVPEGDLAAWIDSHTMRVHARLLERRGSVRRGGGDGGPAFVLEGEYGAALQALPRAPEPSKTIM